MIHGERENIFIHQTKGLMCGVSLVKTNNNPWNLSLVQYKFTHHRLCWNYDSSYSPKTRLDE